MEAEADTYFILKDFRSYAEAQRKIDERYRDTNGWAKTVMTNTAKLVSSHQTELLKNMQQKSGILLRHLLRCNIGFVRRLLNISPHFVCGILHLKTV